MSSPDASTTLTLPDEQAAENRIRAVLGLGPNAASTRRPDHDRGRSGLARGGETPVGARRATEALDSLQQRIAVAEGALKAERSERVAAQRALAEALTVIQQLQTKLAHNEIAATEALEVERQALLSAQAKLEALTVPAPHKPPEKSPSIRKRGRPPLKSKQTMASEPEPEPVQWWLPNYRTLTRRKRTGKRPAADGEPL